MIDYDSVRASAESALARGEYEAAISTSSILIEAGGAWLLDGLVRRAIAMENWASGPCDRFALAASDWQRIVDIAPASISFIGLARVKLKMGDRDSAFPSLCEAEMRGAKSDAWLGLAQFYRTASPPDLKKAKKYYLRAALHGRVNAVRGCVDIAYELDQPYLAVAMVLFGLITAPFYALVLGERRHSSF